MSHHGAGCRRLGVNWYSSVNSRSPSTTSRGHLIQVHRWNGPFPMPVASATQLPNGPTNPTTAAVSESRTSSSSARPTRSGIPFQNGRRSTIS